MRTKAYWLLAILVLASLALSPNVAMASLAPVDSAILGTCSAAVHDRYVVTGPDGQLYRTWHPQVVSNGLGGTCRFAHEHGDNPATSVANAHLPAFGYVGAQVGDVEPHEGFKVIVINQGQANDEGGVAQNSTRIVLHQGTAGPKRFDTRFHSLMFDLTDTSGHYVHVQGMADTAGAGSICASPRQGRTVVTTSGCSISSLYEIWAAVLNIGGKVQVNISMGVFDPITVLNPASLPGQRPLIYTANAYPQFGADYGCNREGYAGPIYWYNANGPTSFRTDAYGNLNSSGALLQQVSAQSVLGVRMSSTNFYQMKLHKSQCASDLGLKN